MKSIDIFSGRTPNIIGKRSEYAVMVLVVHEDGEDKNRVGEKGDVPEKSAW